MSDVEKIQEVVEIMEREGWPGQGSLRRLGAQLQLREQQAEQDEALAKVIWAARAEAAKVWMPPWDHLDEEAHVQCRASARAARQHIAAEPKSVTQKVEYSVSDLESLRDQIIAEGDPDPTPLTVEPPVGSVVRDYEGVRWTRVDAGWIRDCKVSPWLWETVRELLGPLTLVSTPEVES